MLIYTGAMTRSMREPALRAYHAAPDPKIVMSYGACGCTGGIFHDNYCVWGGTDPILPVDVYVPGCPPSPPATIFGFATALGLLDQKLHASHHVAPAGEQAPRSAAPPRPAAARPPILNRLRRVNSAVMVSPFCYPLIACARRSRGSLPCDSSGRWGHPSSHHGRTNIDHQRISRVYFYNPLS